MNFWALSREEAEFWFYARGVLFYLSMIGQIDYNRWTLSDRPKQIVFASESLVVSGLLPIDFLDASQFELCSVEQLDEIFPLAKVKTPSAILIDLSASGERIQALCEQLATLRQSDLSFVLIGIDCDDSYNEPESLIAQGINAVLSGSVSATEIREELQVFLGISLRKFPRKLVDLQVTLEVGGQQQTLLGSVINEECLVVECPSAGELVRYTTSPMQIVDSQSGFSKNLWSTCWKFNDKHAILRYIDPEADLINWIRALPEKPVTKQEIGVCGSSFSVIDFEERYAGQEEQTEVPPIQARAGLAISLLQEQHHHLQTQIMNWQPEQIEMAKGVLQKHRELSQMLSHEVQMHLNHSMKSGDLQQMNQLNALKTELQGPIAVMQRLIDMRGMVQRPRKESIKANHTQSFSLPPQSSKKKSTRMKQTSGVAKILEKLRPALTLLLAIGLIGGSFWFAYGQWAKPRKRLQNLSPKETQVYSEYVRSARQYQGKGQTNLKLFFKTEWTRLDKTQRDQELRSIGQEFLKHGITYAHLYSSQGRLIAKYAQGEFISWSGKVLGSKEF